MLLTRFNYCLTFFNYCVKNKCCLHDSITFWQFLIIVFRINVAYTIQLLSDFFNYCVKNKYCLHDSIIVWYFLIIVLRINISNSSLQAVCSLLFVSITSIHIQIPGIPFQPHVLLSYSCYSESNNLLHTKLPTISTISL